ncbi:MAG: hypothetical protein KGZ56_01785 [Dethiobacter sp.]|nr:hypothetical protein [Dethiobacter sp.]
MTMTKNREKTSHIKHLCLMVTGLFLPPFEAVHLIFVQSLSERFFVRPFFAKHGRQGGSLRTMEYVVEMLRIRKEFPGIVACDELTLQLRKGEIHALLGENGGG